MLIRERCQMLDLFDIFAKGCLLRRRKQERDERKEAYPLVLLLEQVLGVQRMTENLPAGVVARRLQLLDFASDRLKTLFNSSKIGLKSPQQIDCVLESLANLGRSIDLDRFP